MHSYEVRADPRGDFDCAAPTPPYIDAWVLTLEVWRDGQPWQLFSARVSGRELLTAGVASPDERFWGAFARWHGLRLEAWVQRGADLKEVDGTATPDATDVGDVLVLLYGDPSVRPLQSGDIVHRFEAEE